MGIKVTVAGPGGLINYEYYTILKALKAAGVTVIEENDCPEEDPEECLKEIYRRLTDDNWAAPYDWSKKIEVTVKLKAEHWPWGG